jgi:hypothetical protein
VVHDTPEGRSSFSSTIAQHWGVTAYAHRNARELLTTLQQWSEKQTK